MVSHSRWYPYMYILPPTKFSYSHFPLPSYWYFKTCSSTGCSADIFWIDCIKEYPSLPTNKFGTLQWQHWSLYSLNPPATKFFVRQLSQANSKGNIKGPLYAPLLRGIRHWTGQEAAMREASPCLAVKQILDKTTSLLEPAHVWILIPWK